MHDEPHASGLPGNTAAERNLIAAATIAREAFVAGYKAALADLGAKPPGTMLHDWGAHVYAHADRLAAEAWERLR